MQQKEEKPLYTENHEAFRRLLIVGGITFVMGFFFAEEMLADGAFEVLRGWFPVTMWICGLAAWSMCFVLYPKQYAIFDDSLVIDWWYPRRKVIPFDEIRELEAKSFMGRKQLIVRSRGPDYDFGWNMLAPRGPERFAERLEESMNRHRFYNGRDAIQIIPEEPGKGKQRD